MLILLIQTSIRLILVAITDPGYVLEEEDDDVERSIVCSIIYYHQLNTQHVVKCMYHLIQSIVKIVVFVFKIEIIIVNIIDLITIIGFWIGKCVGASNLSHFSNFCLSVVVYFVYMIVTRFPFVQRFIENIYKYDCLLEILLIIYNRLLLINRIRIYNFYIIILNI